VRSVTLPVKTRVMTRLFGTDGIRAEAGRFPLDAPTVRIAGGSLARHLAARIEGERAPLIVIGRDTRESGAWIEEAFVSGASQGGARCASAGVITTPGVAFLARTLPADAGVVISASHNPYQDNGIKIFAPSGQKLDDATELLIEFDIKSGTGPSDSSAVDSGGVKETDSRSEEELRVRYLKYLREEVGRGLSLEGYRIVIDCANGAASQLAPGLLASLGAQVIAINNEPDGRNINRGCGALHIEGLRRSVAEQRADAGVAFDGDADRALFVGPGGQFVDGDATLWILARYLDQREELADKVVVSTVMSNLGLEIALRSIGLKLTRTDVGDKYVLEELMRTGASLGGEQSGHIILPRKSLAGDGMITALSLFRVMRESHSSLKDLTEGFTRYPQVLVNVRVGEKPPFHEVRSLTPIIESIQQQLGGRGRLLLRYSGTEPLARIMIEGEAQEEIQGYADQLAEVIERELAVAKA
jgi:phosphoglucosamine mutase